ncbi:MAG: PIN domain-containing protein [Eubacteriales bacterium]|nr:PIN domain-containing protein [Eubacteriales bacterium]
MTYFFVDYENVKDDGLDAISRLKKEDKVAIFFSVNTPKMGIEVVGGFLSRKLDVQTIKAITGHKDSLDHQLASCLGMTMAKDRENDFCIVTGDTAFDDLVSFWRRRKYKIYRVGKLTDYFRIKKEENGNVK